MITPKKVRELLEKATDGPWEVSREDLCEGERSILIDAKQLEHCFLASAFDIGSTRAEEWNANAAIIAAAPDIAAAYLEAMERIDVLESTPLDGKIVNKVPLMADG